MPDSARFASVFVFVPLAPVVVSSTWGVLCAAHTGGGVGAAFRTGLQAVDVI